MHPHVATDGVVVSDHEVIVKIDKKRLKPAWRKASHFWLLAQRSETLLLRYRDQFQLWSSEGELLWDRRFPKSSLLPQGDRLLRFGEGEIEILDLATCRSLDHFPCPAGHPALFTDDRAIVFLVADPLETDPVKAFHIGERRLLWEKSLRTEMRERYAVDDAMSFQPCADGFVMGNGQHVFGLSMMDGAFLWHRRLGITYRCPQARAGRLYAWVTSGELATHRTTLDATSGEVARSVDASSNAQNRFVILKAETGEILVDLPLASYGEVFRRSLEPLQGTLCKNHIVFAAARTGLLAAFRLSDGELVWHYEHPDELSRPAFDDNRLYVPCTDGTLVVFEAEGEEL